MRNKPRVLELAYERGEIFPLEDGFYYWGPSKNSQGVVSSSNLRDLADELDRLNRDLEKQIKKDLGKRSLRCRLGIHNWEDVLVIVSSLPEHSPEVPLTLQECSRCPKVRGISNTIFGVITTYYTSVPEALKDHL